MLRRNVPAREPSRQKPLFERPSFSVIPIALDAADVRLSARKGSVRARGRGRLGGKDRTVPLHAQARTTLEELLGEPGRPAKAADPQPRAAPCPPGRATRR
ncbi:hypothetical protein [Haloactinospora alba]|uniref:hypothetical protein n=1 Tax=Haloactinospora alba TaxID=405555 RepID=UPI001FE43EE1|nr:hypothetical protein [Haloactinospora alba]